MANPAVSVLRSIAKTISKSKSAWLGTEMGADVLDAEETGKDPHEKAGITLRQQINREKLGEKTPRKTRQSYIKPKLGGYPRAAEEIKKHKDKSGRTPEDVANYYGRTNEFPDSLHMKNAKTREYIYTLLANREVANQVRAQGGVGPLSGGR